MVRSKTAHPVATAAHCPDLPSTAGLQSCVSVAFMVIIGADEEQLAQGMKL